ncbi:MAG: biotin/lipoyl-containing protein, partial [Croceibacterium sp.]
DDVGINGWSMESRVYAEDPYRGFLPSTGRLVRYRPPEPTAAPDGAIRVDDGVAEGGEVSIFYDPMIAKLITWAPTRAEAAALQVQALDQFVIEGPGHNMHFLSALMQHPRFLSGNLTTGFIAEEYPDGFHGAPASEETTLALAAIAAGIECSQRARASRISGQPDRRRPPLSDWVVQLDGRAFTVTLGDGHAMVDGQRMEGTCDWLPGDRTATATGNGTTLGLQVRRDGAHWRIATHGAEHRALALPATIAPLAGHMIEKIPPDLSRFLICPMPGLLVALHVAEGEHVEPGQPLATVEAMKMENILRAQKAGKVKELRARQGESIAADAVILELE